eukprot:TRINITY_DN5009_c0_g1_i1.p1 TRINITY_DN5009_c0_g1~~TRINITY_DN5009_c0_g1_i1.p1  ORF type:complete len:211 (+),score=52.94 TRINITY_DN5009_c0_g1_i1:1-633(+)
MEEKDVSLDPMNNVEKKKKKRKFDKSEKDKEFWNKRRKLYKDNQKKKLESFSTKEEYVESDFYKQNIVKRENKKKWRGVEIETIKFNTPCIIIDLQYHVKMTIKEKKSTVTQLHHLYGTLRNSSYPLKTYVSGLRNNDIVPMLERIGFSNWKVFMKQKNWWEEEEFPKDKLVYLTPESPNVIKEFQNDKFYIIGGLVDHNRLKVCRHSLN